MTARKIRTRPTHTIDDRKFEISGWLDGKEGTYLWFGAEGHYLGTLDGHKLLRLARAIVSQFDNNPD